MRRAWVVALVAACANPSPLESGGSAALVPVAAKPALDIPSAPLPPLAPRDYEAIARKLYADQPDYPTKWPVEFKVRIAEGLLQDLAASARELGDQSLGAPYFADRADFAWGTLGADSPITDAIRGQALTPEAPRARTAAEIADHFHAWLGAFQFVERAVFKPKAAHELPDGGLATHVSIELAGRERAGTWRHDGGSAEVELHKLAGRWQITSFVVNGDYKIQRSETLAFEDVTESWLANANVPAPTRAALRTQSASDDMHRMLLDDKHPPPASLDHLLPLAMDAHPGVVVVDIDGDGYDDLFVWDTAGPSMLLHNDGGRGFSDRTADYGLALTGVSAAAFADLDGDGALDLVVGRWFGHSEILHGAGGKFWPGPSGRFSLPSQVTSVALADMDGDGKLDIYFATSAHDFHQHLVALLDGNPLASKLDPGERALLEEALPAARAAKAAGKLDANIYEIGPRNVAMLNKGDGVFVDATEQLGLTLFRNSLQAAFADVDNDGHPDLYVGNDFAPSNFYLWRNGRYEDVTAQTGADQIYFGMGASFGDFDNDGKLDLYATGMQSTAGNRIMSDDKNFAAEHDAADREARKQAARGNTLLHNDGNGKFSDVTAAGQPFRTARDGSWAYSAQFVDVDGDGYLDVFSPNGFFTSSISPDDPFVRDL